MRSVSFWGKFTSASRISASRGDLLKIPKQFPLPPKESARQTQQSLDPIKP